jgi:hypothetical protein
VTVDYFLSDISNVLTRLALFCFGITHTLPYLIVTYTDDGGLWQFLADIIESLVYCIQPLAGQDSKLMNWFTPALTVQDFLGFVDFA